MVRLPWRGDGERVAQAKGVGLRNRRGEGDSPFPLEGNLQGTVEVYPSPVKWNFMGALEGVGVNMI